jgi:hypothetical protein
MKTKTKEMHNGGAQWLKELFLALRKSTTKKKDLNLRSNNWSLTQEDNDVAHHVFTTQCTNASNKTKEEGKKIKGNVAQQKEWWKKQTNTLSVEHTQVYQV